MCSIPQCLRCLKVRWVMSILLTFLICLTLTGCKALSVGGTKTEVNHVFVGDAPVPGVVQVASNKKIEVISISLDASGKPLEKPNVEMRDCGQFVLTPPQQYRKERQWIADYKRILEEKKKP